MYAGPFLIYYYPTPQARAWAMEETMQKKKMAAALASVNLHLEEEARAVASAALVPAAANFSSGAWPHSGRESIMNLRQLVTMRLWRR